MPIYELFYFKEVKQDLKEAKDWYKQKQEGLEKRFSKDIKTAILRLQKSPQIYEIRYRNIRIAYTDIFPYAIHYYLKETENIIVIVAIIHQHRNPLYPKTRK